MPKYLTRDEKHKKSQRQESRLAKKLGGRKQKGSGSKKFNKGDVRLPEMLTEAKRTDKKSISITLNYLIKITKEAQQYDLIPSLAIAFGYEPQNSTEADALRAVDRDWVLVPSSFLRELLDVYRDRTEED